MGWPVYVKNFVHGEYVEVYGGRSILRGIWELYKLKRAGSRCCRLEWRPV